MAKYVCDVCGWIYDEAAGYPEGVLKLEQYGRMYQLISFAQFVA